MTADIPSVLSKDGTDGLGAVPSVLEESRTDYRGRPSDGTVDNTAPSYDLLEEVDSSVRQALMFVLP